MNPGLSTEKFFYNIYPLQLHSVKHKDINTIVGKRANSFTSI